MFAGVHVDSVEETSLTGISSAKSFNVSAPLELKPMEIGAWKVALRRG